MHFWRCHYCSFTFLLCCFHSVLWAPKWILEAKEKVIPYDASTVRIPSLCVKARFHWGLGNNLVLRESSFSFFDKSYRTSNTEWVVSKELRSTFSSRNLWLRREARWVFFPKGPLLFSSNTGSFTLHSDQSFPGTPSQLCSRTGIDPGNKEEKT